MLKRLAKSAKWTSMTRETKSPLERVAVHELTMLVSSEGKTYKPKWEIMSMLTVDVSTPTRVLLLLN